MDLQNIKKAEELLREISNLEYDRRNLQKLKQFGTENEPIRKHYNDDLKPIIGLVRDGNSIDNHIEITNEELRELVGLLYERKLSDINKQTDAIKDILKTL
jgi:hypothetical protein